MSPSSLQIHAEILSSIESIDPAEWDRGLPEEVENWAYYRAVERAGLAGFALHYVCLRQGARLLAYAPFFEHRYRLDTIGEGGLRRLFGRVARLLPRLLSLPMICLGSPVSEICHVGYAAEMTGEQRSVLLMQLLDALAAHARACGVGLLGAKDAADAASADWRLAGSAGFTRLPGMPSTVLPLPYASLDAYLAALPKKPRSDLRRKLRDSGALVIEERDNVDDVLPQIMQFYEQTRSAGSEQFERLSADYFRQLLAASGGRAVCVLYRVDGRLIGFNLLLRDGRRVLDKFIGLDGTLSREHNLYFVSWLYNVRRCIEQGLCYEPGQAAYETKIRLGCRLLPNWYYFRHANPVVNAALRLLTRWMRLDRQQPALQAAFAGSA